MNFVTTLRAKNLGKRTGAVKFVVLHDTAGSGTEADAHYLANDPEGRSVSVDFVALKDGRVFQLNHDLKGHCTFHAGRHTSFRGILNGSVNQHSVGIEISQFAELKKAGTPLYPEAQVRAVAETCKYICETFGLVRADITTHATIITDGSRSDPRQFPWDIFWGFFGGDTTQPVHASTAPGPITCTVRVGDTLWSLAQQFRTTVENIKALNHMNTPDTTINVGQVLTVKE